MDDGSSTSDPAMDEDAGGDPIRDARILIVDDNAANVALLEGILANDEFHNIHATTDPRTVEGLQAAQPFDLILLDYRMPHMDGVEVMHRLARAMRDDYLPVLVLTAQDDRATRLKALEAGAKDFITKPFDSVEVLHRIRNMLEVRRLYNDRKRENERLEAAVRARTHELEETRRKIIERLGRAGEYRDNETGMHVIRMSKCCQLLALRAGLPETEAELILQASPMHDVGKIGVPDSILLKPGKLTTDEWELMKTHAEIGGDIIGDDPSALLQAARVIALTHHEKWDGTGYPRGLSGEDIPIAGRIAAICDVFDALLSERPYKQPWSFDEAVAYIRDNAGRHFDPRLARLFLEALPEIMVIRETYKD